MTGSYCVLRSAYGVSPRVRVALLLVMLGLVGAALVVVAYLDVTLRHRHRIVEVEQVEARPVAVVFGAGLQRGGRLSAVLSDRMQTAVALYHAGKVDFLLLSGDNSSPTYNEPARMGEYALAGGVPAEALVYDYAGWRTYDSCYRARHIFGHDQVILVTQAYHLPRALYICQQLGIDAVGVSAAHRSYRLQRWFETREVFARVRAWFDVHLLRPHPVYV